MVGGFFPTPYPDECLYSILCRYYVRCGGVSYTAVVKDLFGAEASLLQSVYLPISVERVDAWYPKSSGITRRSIVVNNTLYPFWAVSNSSQTKSPADGVLSVGESVDSTYNIFTKTRSSRVRFFRYCTQCAAEDIEQYGETYWHRQHQLAEMPYCMKHETRLVVSSVPLHDAIFRFSPASEAVNTGAIRAVPDDLTEHKDGFLKIGRECQWLIAHGMDVDWSFNGYEKYWRLLRDKDLASFWGKSYYAPMDSSFFSYWGKDFLDALFDTVEIPRFNSWYHRIGIQQVSDFTPLFHVLTMCWLAGSVKGFTESNPAETPFGHPPYACENKICSHYHIDGAKMIRLVDYGSGKAGYFECEYCGLVYKYAISSCSKGHRDVVDYGHLWLGELRRCCRDPKITIKKTMETLKCGPQTLERQKIINGLMRKLPYGNSAKAMNYYKSQVLKICQEYDEVTITLLDKLAPRAYEYLQDRDYEWIRSRVTFENERTFRIERENLLLDRLQKLIAAYDAEGYPNKVLSYGYIAGLIGATRDELRHRMSPNSKLRTYLDEIVEHKATWRQERAARIGVSYTPRSARTPKQKQQPRSARTPKPKQPWSVCTPMPKQSRPLLSKHEELLLNRIRDIISNFETGGYPDRQLSLYYLAILAGTTPSKLTSTAATGTELRELLDDVVEHRGAWQEERAAKPGNRRSTREMLLQDTIDIIQKNPPNEQVSYNYIAQKAGITEDVLKDSPHLRKLVSGFTESNEDWLKRRFIMAYNSKPVVRKPYSALMTCSLARIDWKTYKKHQCLFDELLDYLPNKQTL